MQISYRYPAFLLLFLLTLAARVHGQVRIVCTDPAGFAVRPDTVTAWSSFGTTVSATVSPEAILVHGEIRRMAIQASGFHRLDTIFKISLRSGDSATITLQPITGPMDEIVISSGKLPARLSGSTVSISVLKPYLVENKISADVSTILEQVPGVNITDGQVNIRSGSGWSYGAGSRVMVTLDELPMLSPDAGAVQFSFLPVENLSAIEVVKSAGSVLYGSNALNGVVNLRSAEPTPEGNARLSTFTGFYDFPLRDSLRWNSSRRGVHGINGFWGRQMKHTSLTVQWNGLYDQGYRMNELNHRARLSLRLKHRNQKIEGLSYGINTGLQRGKSGSFLLWENDQYGYTSLDSGYNFNRSWRFNADPFAEWNRKKGTHKLLSRVLAIENAVTSDQAGTDQSNGSSMLYSEYRYVRRLRQLTLTGGAVAMLAESHSPLFGGNQRARNMAAFTQADYRKGRFTASAGARYEYYAVNLFNQQKPVFRAGLNYQPARATFLRMSWGQGFRFPSMAELFTSTSTGAVTVFANPDLRPETGWNAELGIKQGFKLGQFRGFADMSLFSMLLSNMMEFTFGQWSLDPAAPNLGLGFKSLNSGKGQVSGMEVELAGDGKIGQTRWQLLAGYTYTNAVSLSPTLIYGSDSAGNSLSFESTRSNDVNFLKYRFKHLLRLDIQCRYKQIETGLSFRYNSPMPNIDKAFVEGILPFFIPGIARARDRISTALVLDFRLGYHLNEHLKLNLQATNLLNREYMYRPADIRPPRAVQLQLVWQLR